MRKKAVVLVKFDGSLEAVNRHLAELATKADVSEVWDIEYGK